MAFNQKQPVHSSQYRARTEESFNDFKKVLQLFYRNSFACDTLKVWFEINVAGKTVAKKDK